MLKKTKKVKLTNHKIEEVLTQLNKFKAKKTPTDALTMYKIVKNIKKLEEIIKPYLEVKNSLIVKYGKSDKDGNIAVEQKNLSEFAQELQPIANEVNDIEIQIIDLDSIKGMTVDMDDMLALEIMIKDGED
ncbi:MAG: hypothetical protein GX995_07045 [Clostridiales bacterium]|nr:hypothetical protein [Clostridiales bacterium]